MNPQHFSLALASVIIFLLLSGCKTTDWTYRKTRDGISVLGRSEREQAISIEQNGSVMRIMVPPGAEVHSAIDEPMDSLYAVDLDTANAFMAINVEPVENQLPVPVQHSLYLAGIHKHYDPEVRMAPFHEFTLPRGLPAPAYLYSSEYWGNRLVIIIPDAKITTTFEFTGTEKGKETITKAIPAIQEILNSYSVRDK